MKNIEMCSSFLQSGNTGVNTPTKGNVTTCSAETSGSPQKVFWFFLMISPDLGTGSKIAKICQSQLLGCRCKMILTKREEENSNLLQGICN